MIENQEQANQRANEIAKKYQLTEAFHYEGAQEIANALQQFVGNRLGTDAVDAAIKIMELAYYLDKKIEYTIALSDLYLRNQQYELAISLTDVGLAMQPSRNQQIELYDIVVSSSILAGYFEEAIDIFDQYAEELIKEQDPLLTALVAYALASIDRTEEAVSMLELNMALIEEADPTATAQATSINQDTISIINKKITETITASTNTTSS